MASSSPIPKTSSIAKSPPAHSKSGRGVPGSDKCVCPVVGCHSGLGGKPLCLSKTLKNLSNIRAHVNDHISELGSLVLPKEWLNSSQSRICPKCGRFVTSGRRKCRSCEQHSQSRV